MAPTSKSAGNLSLLGGRACLDFVNTLDWRGTDSPVEYLHTCQDLIDWSRHARTISGREADLLSQAAVHRAADGAALLSAAINLRETIHQLFCAIALGRPAPARGLAMFNRYLSETLRFSRIVPKASGYAWDVEIDPDSLDSILNPLVRSAADLLVSKAVQRVKRCGDPSCGWLFVDTSRNNSRRWCDMQDCGNRAKASRFYKKKSSSS